MTNILTLLSLSCVIFKEAYPTNNDFCTWVTEYMQPMGAKPLYLPRACCRISEALFLLEMSHDSWPHCAVLLQLSYTLHQDIRAGLPTGMERWKLRLQHESWQSDIRPWSCCFLTVPGPTAPLETETVFTSAMHNPGDWCEHRIKLKIR